MSRKLFQSITGLVLIIIVLASCSQLEQEFTDKEGKTYKTNKVYKSVETINEDDISYAIFFPESYTGKHKLPILFLLDPHGQGAYPLEKYADVANKQNYILVGSNLNRNGLTSVESESIIKSIKSDVVNRFTVDTKRMFIGGFSGGAKLAFMYADKMPEFIGAMACGGSLPVSFDKEPHYYFVGIIGNQDFNYLEMRQSFTLYDQYGFDYTAITFNGKHAWPPAESFEMGLIGFNLYSTKIGKLETTDFEKEAILNRLNDSVKVCQQQNRVIDEYEFLQQSYRWFYGLSPVTDIQKSIAQLTQSRAFREKVQKRQNIVQQEVKLRREFIKAIEIKNNDWWVAEVSKIKSSTDTKSEAFQVKQRLLNYISMASYMLIKNDLNDEDLDKALEKIKIYELVDPTNYDVSLMYAKYYLALGKRAEMVESFKKAKAKGLVNYNSYSNDLFWMDLFSQEVIKAVL